MLTEEEQQQRPSLSLRDVVGISYRDQLEGARSYAAPTRPRGSTRGRMPSSRRSYNTKRTSQLRQIRGKETLADVQDGIDRKIDVGLKDIEDALHKIEATSTLNAVTMLVTTRTMGFCAAQIYFHASKQRNPVFCDIYAF